MFAKTRFGSLRFFGLTGLFVVSFGMAFSFNPTGQIQTSNDECISCHREIGDHWIDSSHGQAGSNTAFLTAWDEQGNVPGCMTCHASGYDPIEQTWETPGVSCLTCHTPSADSHPEKVMLTDTSSNTCGTCHLETFSQWQESTHGFENQSCNECHNPHTTDLLIENSEQLCESCHSEQVQFFRLTAHAVSGLSCTDCHLGNSGGALMEGHGQRDHTFGVDLLTCTGCHNDSRHSPHEANTIEAVVQEASTEIPDPHRSTVPVEPEQASELGFAILGILVGLGFGIVLGPWLDLRSSQATEDEMEAQ